jgi:hypothetical protein
MSPSATFAILESAVDFGVADGSQTDLVTCYLVLLRTEVIVCKRSRASHGRFGIQRAQPLACVQCGDSLYDILCGSE